MRLGSPLRAKERRQQLRALATIQTIPLHGDGPRTRRALSCVRRMDQRYDYRLNQYTEVGNWVQDRERGTGEPLFTRRTRIAVVEARYADWLASR